MNKSMLIILLVALACPIMLVESGLKDTYMTETAWARQQAAPQGSFSGSSSSPRVITKSIEVSALGGRDCNSYCREVEGYNRGRLNNDRTRCICEKDLRPPPITIPGWASVSY